MNSIIIITLIPMNIIGLHHLLTTKCSSKIWIKQQFIIGYFSQLLYYLNEMCIVDGYSSTITDKNITWIKLSDLIDNKILHDKFNKKGLINLDILFLSLLKQLRKMLFQ